MAGNVAVMTSADVSGLTPLISSAAAVEGDADLGRVLHTLASQAIAATGARYAAIGVIGEHGALSEFIYDGIEPALARRIGHPPSGKGVLGTVIKERSTIVLDEITSHPDSVGFPANHPPMHSFLGVPVMVGDEAFGNLYLAEKEGGFNERDIDVAEALSRIAGSAVQTARLNTRLRRVAVVEDRQRIARDLHDSVIQDLFAIGLGLQAVAAKLDDDEVVETLDKSIDTLDGAVNALRGYIFELKETTRITVGLDERLQQMVARMGATYPAHVELTVEGSVGEDWDDEVLMLATEALSNALRHSRSDHVDVHLIGGEQELVLRIVDDGVGFERGSERNGMGLANMQARAKALGGGLLVKTEPGGGTTVEARIPVRGTREPS